MLSHITDLISSHNEKTEEAKKFLIQCLKEALADNGSLTMSFLSTHIFNKVMLEGEKTGKIRDSKGELRWNEAYLVDAMKQLSETL